jgi:hypothetical protein
MAYAIWPELSKIDLLEMAKYVPSSGLERDFQEMSDGSSPCNQLVHRVIKEHTPFNALAERHVKRAIYIIRDGRDVLVSYWHFCNQRDGTQISFSEFLKKSADTTYFYGPWREHVLGWLDAKLDAKLVIRYEDMICDPVRVLTEALRFVGISRSDKHIQDAVNRASFDELRELEREKGLSLAQLKSVTFFREGRVGSWRDTFTAKDMSVFIRLHGGDGKEVGYDW